MSRGSHTTMADRPSSDIADPDSPITAWAAESIVRRASDMLSHLGGVTRGEDIEAVHDMRVASRRLVAAMRVFGAYFPSRKYAGFAREGRAVTRALGSVRDLDVLIDQFKKTDPGLHTPAGLGARYMLSLLRRTRESTRPPMLKALHTIADSGFVPRLSKYLSSRGDSGAVSFRSAAPQSLQQRYDEFYGFRPYVHDPTACTELHDMRIAAKWFRYTMELFAPAYSDGLKDNLERVKRFQELLGDLHDSDIRLELLATTLGASLKARHVDATGEIHPDRVREGVQELSRQEHAVRDACYRAFLEFWESSEQEHFSTTCRDRIAHPDAAYLGKAEP